MADKNNPSKELMFDKAGALADEMITAHGDEFAIGVFLMTARAIAESKAAREKKDAPPPEKKPGRKRA
jgi:hypothetical protein